MRVTGTATSEKSEEPAIGGLRLDSPRDTARFAFVIHPYRKEHYARHPWFVWARYLPLPVVEWVCAWIPAIALGKVRGEINGKRLSGYLIGLPDTHRVILKRSPEHTYRKIERAARWAEKKGAGIIGLGAYTSVAGDAGITLAERLCIGVTTGNALSVWSSLETLRDALASVGWNLRRSHIAILGATGGIGSAVARILSAEVSGFYLVSRTPEKLESLKETLLQRNPALTVSLDVTVDGNRIRECDAVVSTTSSVEKPVMDVSYLAPGAVVVDIAQPPDFPEDFARQRRDCLFLEAGEVCPPSGIRTDFPLPLPDGVLYGCLGETILLALEGRYEDFAVGREITEEQIRWIGGCAKGYGFRAAPLTQFGKLLTREEIESVTTARNSRR
jgi:predicted amino acid dehydrogenase